jgi:hypothetical protein
VANEQEKDGVCDGICGACSVDALEMRQRALPMSDKLIRPHVLPHDAEEALSICQRQSLSTAGRRGVGAPRGNSISEQTLSSCNTAADPLHYKCMLLPRACSRTGAEVLRDVEGLCVFLCG